MPLVIHDSLTPVVIETFAGKALDVAGNAVTDTAKVLQWDKHGQPNQQWYVDPCGADVYRIIGRQSGRVLDVPDGRPGEPIQIYAWAANANQRWAIEANDTGIFLVLAANRDLVLDVAQASPANGAKLCVWYRNGGSNQRFKLTT